MNSVSTCPRVHLSLVALLGICVTWIDHVNGSTSWYQTSVSIITEPPMVLAIPKPTPVTIPMRTTIIPLWSDVSIEGQSIWLTQIESFWANLQAQDESYLLPLFESSGVKQNEVKSRIEGYYKAAEYCLRMYDFRVKYGLLKFQKTMELINGCLSATEPMPVFELPAGVSLPRAIPVPTTVPSTTPLSAPVVTTQVPIPPPATLPPSTLPAPTMPSPTEPPPTLPPSTLPHQTQSAPNISPATELPPTLETTSAKPSSTENPYPPAVEEASPDVKTSHPLEAPATPVAPIPGVFTDKKPGSVETPYAPSLVVETPHPNSDIVKTPIVEPNHSVNVPFTGSEVPSTPVVGKTNQNESSLEILDGRPVNGLEVNVHEPAIIVDENSHAVDTIFNTLFGPEVPFHEPEGQQKVEILQVPSVVAKPPTVNPQPTSVFNNKPVTIEDSFMHAPTGAGQTGQTEQSSQEEPPALAFQPSSAVLPSFDLLDHDHSGSLTSDDWTWFLHQLVAIATEKVMTIHETTGRSLVLQQVRFHYAELHQCIFNLISKSGEQATTLVRRRYWLFRQQVQQHCYVRFRFSLLGGTPAFEFLARHSATITLGKLREWFLHRIAIAQQDLTLEYYSSLVPVQATTSRLHRMTSCLYHSIGQDDTLLDKHAYYEVVRWLYRCSAELE